MTRRSPSTPQPERLALGVPAYMHPLAAPEIWQRLVEAADQLRFVIVNVHDGQGEASEPAYVEAITSLRRAKIRTLGYIDTDYGRRPVGDVVSDARAWASLYGVNGVFFDQVASDFRSLEYYADCALGARAAGAQFVVLNPGNDCHPGLAEIANVLVTFEGTWAGYQEYEPSLWMLEHAASRFCHLVYDVPADAMESAPAEALARHALCAMFSDGGGDNPWDRLPPDLVRAAAGLFAPDEVQARQTYSWQQRGFAPSQNTTPPGTPRHHVPQHEPGRLARLVDDMKSFVRPKPRPSTTYRPHEGDSSGD